MNVQEQHENVDFTKQFHPGQLDTLSVRLCAAAGRGTA
jgi:hypothetical protein